MGRTVARAALVCAATLLGARAMGGVLAGDGTGYGLGGILGAGLGLLAVWAESGLGRVSLGSAAGGAAGLVAGLLAALLAIGVAGAAMPGPSRPWAALLAGLILAYLGAAAGAAQGRRLWGRPGEGAGALSGASIAKILDTSVIIDGRVADICEAGFLDGPLVLPQFVLKELQQIADSSDPLKRNRGRRGLDVLHRIQQMPGLDIQIVDTDFPRVREVDAKLVLLAKEMPGKVMTNDFNLNKVAELQGVAVLNINELANAVKPIVLPGEEMSVFVLKEGKEHGQGVGYLDDGTMVVVDHARDRIGHNVSVSVTSVLQTTAGRMIFTKLRDESEPQRNGG
ncbi:MAG: PIN domain-containing protein [Nitrospinota bacterium]